MACCLPSHPLLEFPKVNILFKFSPRLLVSTALAIPNLLDKWQRGRILGSSFGVPGADASFDFFIVDGATARLTVAAGLAENPAL